MRQYGKEASMSAKRPSLAESMRQAAAADPPPATPAAVPAPAPRAARAEPTARPPGFYAATRAGKKKVTASVDPATHKRLKCLALELDSTAEALLLEAITDLFTKHGKSARKT